MCADCGTKFADERRKVIERAGWDAPRETHPHLRDDCKQCAVTTERQAERTEHGRQEQDRAVPEQKTGGWFSRLRGQRYHVACHPKHPVRVVACHSLGAVFKWLPVPLVLTAGHCPHRLGHRRPRPACLWLRGGHHLPDEVVGPTGPASPGPTPSCRGVDMASVPPADRANAPHSQADVMISWQMAPTPTGQRCRSDLPGVSPGPPAQWRRPLTC